MVIKNKELRKMLKEYGREYTLTMYVNRFFHMTNKQLEYVLKYGEKNEQSREIKQNTMWYMWLLQQ